MDDDLDDIILNSMQEMFDSIIKALRYKISLQPHEAALMYNAAQTGLKYFFVHCTKEEDLHDNNEK